MNTIREIIGQAETATGVALSFLNETRAGKVNVENAKLASQLSGRVFSGVKSQVSTRLNAPKIAAADAKLAAIESVVSAE